MRWIVTTSLISLLSASAADELFEAFEGDGFGTWEETGTGFGKGPTAGGQGELAGKVQGYAQESFASSFEGGAGSVGELTSPTFTITEPYISFLIGGGGARSVTSLQLLVGEEIVREQPGQNDHLLRPRTWNVRDLNGKVARLRLVDRSTEPGGFILADHILFTDQPNSSFPAATRDGEPFEPGLVPTETVAGMTIPDGSSAGMFATHEQHQVTSPTALCIDEQGRILITETHRFRFGIFDNRNHTYWHTDDIAATTTADRLAMHRKWDEKLPVAKLTEKSEVVRLLVDNDGDGKADRAEVFADGFDDALDGTAAGIYSYNGTVYFACIPSIWALRDTNGDGTSDERKALFNGFGVRVSLSGHDLNGFALGPDGRLYGTMGDRAMNVTTPDGQNFRYTDQGTIFRFNPDGSGFEVVHAGLRNPKEIAFDEFGNGISVDNNSDQGDKARVVYLVEGADSGWRTDHQNLHTFHKQVGYEKRPINQWMQERQWDTWHKEQPAFLLPPIDLLTSGPSGLTYHPGTGFSQNCLNSFLVCDYRGSPAASGIWAFQVQPAGAGMEMVRPRKFNWGAAVTDVEFGYDGRLYVTDFITGWQSHEAGRIYTLSSPESLADPAAREVSGFLRKGLSREPVDTLYRLLGHPDQRLRLRAQIELAGRPEAVPYFINATKQTDDPMRRLHGVWGLWMRARLHQSEASAAQLLALLSDHDPEIRAQAARALGEAPLATPGPLINALRDSSNRVQAFAALAIARHGLAQAFNDVLLMLAENADRDVYLRHAGVVALVRTARNESQIAALQTNPNRSLRLAAVIALRRLASPRLVSSFFDEDSFLADEAIRAVHDVPVAAARPAVAALLDEYSAGQNGRPLSRMMLRRLLHSAFRVGGSENASRILAVAANEALDPNERHEALRLLSIWEDPPPVDQSLGRYEPFGSRKGSEAAEALTEGVAPLLAMKGQVLAAAIGLVRMYDLDVPALDSGLAGLLEDRSLGGGPRSEALELLASREPDDLTATLLRYAGDEDQLVAGRALELLAAADPSLAVEPARAALKSPNVRRKQEAWRLLGTLPVPEAAEELSRGLRALSAGNLPKSVALDVLEAASKREEANVKEALASYQSGLPTDDPLAPFEVTLVGGDAKRGKAIFETHAAGQCMRCHRVAGGHSEGGEAGPNLAGLGKRQDSRAILESLISPSAALAPGFGIVSLTFGNGASKAGMLLRETDDTVELLEGETLWSVRKSDIVEQSNPVSAMPPMGALLSKSEIRDLVAWLGSLKKGSPPEPPKRELKPLDPSTLTAAPPTAPAPSPNTPDKTMPEDAPKPTEGEPQTAETEAATAPDRPEATEGAAPDAKATIAAAPIDPAQLEAGKAEYVKCLACHGAEGQGLPNVGPPLAGSEWVVGPAENLIRIQMRGLTGPIKVKGQELTFVAPMPPHAFQTDEQIANVLTYIRNSWGNQATAVSAEEVAGYRDEAGKAMLTAADLIPPPPITSSPASTGTPGSNASTRTPEVGGGFPFLTVAIVLIWLALCTIPALRMLSNREAK